MANNLIILPEAEADMRQGYEWYEERREMRIRPIPLFLRRLALPAESRSRYARNLRREDAYEGLKKITGEDFGYDVKAWREWVKKHMTLDGRPRKTT